MPPIRRALLSVSDKSGLVKFAHFLVAQSVELISTGHTAQLLREHAIAVQTVSDYTGFPEMMDGRVKTLHPRIHAGILARSPTDDAVLAAHGIAPIDLVVVNLYPFQQTVATDCTLAQAIDMIDIGGPAMLRAAAKNHEGVTVIVEPADYGVVQQAMTEHAVAPALRFSLATKAFAHTARYDTAIAQYLNGLKAQKARDASPPAAPTVAPPGRWPPTLLSCSYQQELRYGENPHQAAAFYRAEATPNLAAAQQGKALSYNNIADADAALACVEQFTAPACVIVKHANPCGVAIAADCQTAYQQAYRADPESAYGGVIALNRTLDATTAAAIIAQQFVEVIIAPELSADAMAACRAKPHVRLLTSEACGALATDATDAGHGLEYKMVQGGMLVQTRDTADYHSLTTPTRRQPSAAERADLLFAWRVAKFVKSNAIVYARAQMTIGIGAGQSSRVHSARIAGHRAEQAGLAIAGAVMASDAFLPFADAIEHAAAAGITAVIQPGGARRDAAVIAVADAHEIAMLFTAMRHFKH